MKIVEVTWLDAWSEQDDVTIEALEGLKPITRHNIGYLIQETEDVIILAAGISEKTAKSADMHAKDTFTERILIPRGTIQQIWILDKGHIYGGSNILECHAIDNPYDIEGEHA